VRQRVSDKLAGEVYSLILPHICGANVGSRLHPLTPVPWSLFMTLTVVNNVFFLMLCQNPVRGGGGGGGGGGGKHSGSFVKPCPQ